MTYLKASKDLDLDLGLVSDLSHLSAGVKDEVIKVQPLVSKMMMSGVISLGLGACCQLAMAQEGVVNQSNQKDADRIAILSRQISSPEPSVTLPSVVVTANPLSKSTDQMATATSVVTKADLELQVASTLGDVLKYQPGLAADTFGQGASRPIIRNQTAPRVQVMQNGIRVQDASQISPDHQVSVPILGAEQIEVIKGTSALMFGGGAVGGVVNVVDNTIPTERLATPISGRASLMTEQASDGYQGFVNLNGDINEHWLWSGRYQKSDKGNIQVPHWDTKEVANSWYTQDNGSLGLTYLTDLGYVGASYQRQSSEYGLPFHVHNHCAPSLSRPNQLDCQDDHHHDHDHGAPPFVGLTSDVYQIHAKRDFPMIGVDNIQAKLAYTDYRHDEIDEGEVGTTFSNKALSAKSQATTATYRTGTLGFMKGVVGIDADQSRFSAEGLEGYLPKTDTHQVGVYVIQRLTPTYFGAKFSDDKFAGNDAELSRHLGHDHSKDGMSADHSSLALSQADALAKAVATDQYKSPWYVEFGARQDFQNIKDAENQLQKSQSATSVSLEGGKYVTMNTQLSARLSHSERLPAAQELFANGAHLATNTWERGNTQLNKERTYGAEVSARFDDGQDFSGSVSAFYNDIQDYIYAKTQDIVQSGESAGFRLIDYTQSDAKHFGGEVEGRYRINDYLTVKGFADLALIKLKNSGQDQSYAPRLVAPRVGAELLSQWGPVDISLSGYHRFLQDKLADFETIAPSYNLVDAKITYHSQSHLDYTAFLQVNNLLNELAYNHASYLVDHVPLAERSVNAGITYRF